jgi:hypothetical protein
MDKETVERVRDAIVAELGVNLGEQGAAEHWDRVARAAILALREPTEAMIAAAAETPGMKAANSAMELHQARGYGFAEGSFDGGSPLEQAWKAMIDVASDTIPIVDMKDLG